jgi:hypothetical protein
MTLSSEQMAPIVWLAAEAIRDRHDPKKDCVWIVERGQFTGECHGVGSRRHALIKRSRSVFASQARIS